MDFHGLSGLNGLNGMVFSQKDAADILREASPVLYQILLETVAKGADPDVIVAMVRRSADSAKSPDNPQAGELTVRLAENTAGYFRAMADQIGRMQ